MKPERPAALSVSLPRSMRKFVDQRVRGGGFGNVSEYIRTLIRADQAGALPLAAAGLPGFGPRVRPDPGVGRAAEDGTAVDLAAEDWRELRDALLRGERWLQRERAREIAGLFALGLELRRAALRREMPDATEADREANLARWLQQRAGGTAGDGPGRPVSAERRRRILGE